MEVEKLEELKIPNYKELEEKIKNLSQYKEEIEKVLFKETTLVCQTLMGGAIMLKSSDVHLEPKKDFAQLRVRLDGILHDVINFDLKVYKLLLSRLKLMAGLKLNITDKPQDGRFSILVDREIEVRVSSLPSEYGETIVMRLLDPKSLLNLEDLGLRKDLLETLEREIKKLFEEHNLNVVRSAGSLGKADLVVEGIGRVQVKARKKISLYKFLKNVDALIVKADREEPLLVIPLRAFFKFLER